MKQKFSFPLRQWGQSLVFGNLECNFDFMNKFWYCNLHGMTPQDRWCYNFHQPLSAVGLLDMLLFQQIKQRQFSIISSSSKNWSYCEAKISSTSCLQTIQIGSRIEISSQAKVSVPDSSGQCHISANGVLKKMGKECQCRSRWVK